MCCGLCWLRKQENRRACGTVINKAVIHLYEVHLNHSQILTTAQSSNNTKSNPTLTLTHPNPKVTPNVAATLNPTFNFRIGYLVQCPTSPNVASIVK